jgi:heme iron utilization protein
MSEIIKDMREVSKVARAFMKNWDTGVLSTQFSKEGNDFPFGTIAPFVLTEEGDVTILISNIAIHTKNILENPRVGFTVFDMEAVNKQASPRVCLTGTAELVDQKNDPEKYAAVSERYFSFFPAARNYFKAHGFYFYNIRPDHIHFIRTFGQIYTFDAEDFWHLPTPEWKGMEASAIEHMNADHKDALKKYALTYLELESEDINLISVDGEGFHLKVDEKIYYLNFLNSAFDREGLRREFVALSRDS